VDAETIRVPGILAGLNERSQSAYAAPAPKPVDKAIGHVRPEVENNTELFEKSTVLL
jgi:hypothetical protein